MGEKVNNKDLFDELADWTAIINSPAWDSFVDLLNRRASYLNTQVLSSIKDDNMHNAKNYTFRLEECKTILKKVSERMKCIKSEMNKSNAEGGE